MMKKNIRLWMLLVSMLLAIVSCTDNMDNPVIPEPEDPETPEQQAFWAPFDAWKTDSCTVGDDFFMHMIGTWWKNPVDIYPGGLMTYADKINNQRVEEIYQMNPNLQHLTAHADESLTMSEEEVQQMVNEKVEELWAGATTREEALAALGRAWAEGYTLLFDPIVTLIDGEPTWQLTLKFPSYINENHLYKDKQLIWHIFAPHKSASMKTRGTQSAVSDLDIIVEAMNIGVDHMEIAENAVELFLNIMDTEWNTVEGIKEEIEQAVALADGVLVNEEFLDAYNDLLPDLLSLQEDIPGEIILDREQIIKHVLKYMANNYALNDYNRQYITPQMRQQYAEWCEMFREAMRQRLDANTWLEDATRQNALDKLDAVVFYVGGIDVIPNCVIPTLTGNNLIDDVRQMRLARMDGYRWAASRSRSAVAMLLHSLNYISDITIDNACYMPNYNIVCIYPSNLCTPYVEEEYEDALQWAFLGTTIGHELTHGFDSMGSQFDLWGNEINWWTDADAAKFNTLCNQLTDQYNNLQLMPWEDPTLYGDGKNTLGENIADLGGCCIALQILLDLHPHATVAQLKALSQRFFQGWAIQWSNSYSLIFVKFMKIYDVHSQARERTNGVVRNVDEWYDAYDIQSGTLYLQPSQRVHIW